MTSLWRYVYAVWADADVGAGGVVMSDVDSGRVQASGGDTWRWSGRVLASRGGCRDTDRLSAAAYMPTIVGKNQSLSTDLCTSRNELFITF